MKQLNNTVTGEVIKIKKISDTNVYYTIYENTMFMNKNIFGIDKYLGNSIDKSIIVPKDSFIQPDISINDMLEHIALEQIQSIETNFIISDDLTNWCINLGSTGIPTTMRIFFPNEAYDIALNNRDLTESEYYGLWQIIAGCQTDMPTFTAKNTYNCYTQYMEMIFPQILDIIQYDSFPINCDGTTKR